MSEKLLETQSWLENFSNRWEKVLSRSTCASRQSRTRPNTGKPDSKASPDLLPLDNLPHFSQSQFVGYEENEVEGIRERFADASRAFKYNQEDLEDQRLSLKDINSKIHALQSKYTQIIRSLFDHNASLKQEIKEKSQESSLGGILTDYESHIDNLKFKIEEYEKICGSLASIEENSSLKRPKHLLKSIKTKVERDLEEEKYNHQLLQGVDRKLQMSKKCLQNLVKSNAKVEIKQEETKSNLNNIQEELLILNTEIQKALTDRKLISTDLKEQRDLKITLEQLFERVKFHGKLAKEAQKTLQNIKDEEVGIVLLKDLRAYFQRLRDVKRVDLCNQLHLNLTKIYDKKKEAESKETCLTNTYAKHISRPHSARTKNNENKSPVFSFLKEVN